MSQGLTGIVKGQGPNKYMEGFMESSREAFGDMSFNQAKGVIVDAATGILTKAIDVLFTMVLPNLLQMYIGGLFEALSTGGLISKIFAVMGLV